MKRKIQIHKEEVMKDIDKWATAALMEAVGYRITSSSELRGKIAEFVITNDSRNDIVASAITSATFTEIDDRLFVTLGLEKTIWQAVIIHALQLRPDGKWQTIHSVINGDGGPYYQEVQDVRIEIAE